MTITLISQIDIDHWTISFLDGEWKDKTGDYKVVPHGLEAGQHVEVEAVGKLREPTTSRYGGVLKVKAVAKVAAPVTKKKK